MLTKNPCDHIEESMAMVQGFRGLLEKELRDLALRDPSDYPIPRVVRDRAMIRLAHLRTSARRVKQDLNSMRQYFQRTKLETLSYLNDFDLIKTNMLDRTKPCYEEKKVGKPVAAIVQGDDKENHTQNRQNDYRFANQQLAAKKGRRHYSEAYVGATNVPSVPKEQPVKIQPVRDTAVTVPQSTPAEPPTSCLKDLRSNIYRELEQLRSIEHREKIVRNLNDSRHRSVSEAKKKPQHEPTPIPESKHTQSVIQYEEKKIAKVSSNLTFETQLSDMESVVKDIQQQDIKVHMQARPTSQISLHCPNHHEYYVGSTIGKVPHGHGRFYNCCSSVPLSVPDGVQFYTGNFSKGKFEGYGTLTTKEGVKFVGNFKNGLKHGEGSLFYRGKVEIARWAHDKFISNI